MEYKVINEAEFKKAFDTFLRETAKEVTDDIEGAYQGSIKEFYNDYSPSSYSRTLELRAASNKWRGKNNPRKVGTNMYVAGIIVDSDNIEGEPYRADKDWVFVRAFDEGIHGFSSDDAFADEISRGGTIPPKMKPTPNEIVDDFMEKEMDLIDKKMDRQMNIMLGKLLKGR